MRTVGKTKRATSATRRAARPAARPASIDDYLAGLPDDKRRALARLRAQIRAAAPEAIESISYGMPTFKLDGRPLVYFAAAAAHCSLYGVGDTDAKGAPVAELKNYDTSGKGTLRFRADKPPPAALVRKLVKARIALLSTSRSGPYGARSAKGPLAAR